MWEILPKSAVPNLDLWSLAKTGRQIFTLSSSFPNMDWQEKTSVRIRSLNCDLWICFRVPIACWSCLSPAQLLPSCSSYFASWELGTSGCWPPKYGWPWGNVGCISILTWVQFQLLEELSNSFFLLVIFQSGSGSREGSILCIFFGDASCIHGIVQYCQEYLLCITPETWQDIWKDFFLKYQ